MHYCFQNECITSEANLGKYLVGWLTWEERDKLIEEFHTFVATLSLRSATLFQKP